MVVCAGSPGVPSGDTGQRILVFCLTGSFPRLSNALKSGFPMQSVGKNKMLLSGYNFFDRLPIP